MTDAIGKPELARMFAGAAEQIRREHQHLSELDSVAGDGDHGTTMLRVAEQLEAAAGPGAPEDLKTLLYDTGWNIMGVDGGASSAILGAFFAGMADAEIRGPSMDRNGLAGAFEAGLRALSRQTQAQVGDKTMMDALVPAVNAFGATAAKGNTVAEALKGAANAAHLGADSTKDLIARHGRAKFLGEKTRGSPDPGATSISLLFRGFYVGLTNEGK